MRYEDKMSLWRVAATDPDSPLAIVIVTDNSADVLPGLLDSLHAGLDGIAKCDVVVVDNASRDGSAELALAHPILPRVIRMEQNAGYAAGINAATATVEPYADVLILTPDIRLLPGAARRLAHRLNDQSVGVTVPQIVNKDGAISCSLRREPSIKTAWSDALLGTRIAARMGLGEIVIDPVLYRQGGKIDWAKAAIVAVAARARLAVGDWDEQSLPYDEDVDYFERVRSCGLAVEYVSQARAIHVGDESHDDPRRAAATTVNRIRYFRRHHGRLATVLFRLSIIVGETMRAAQGPEHRAALRAALAA